MKFIISAAVAAVLLFGSSHLARAAEPAMGKKAVQIQLFSDADTNHDGKLTAQEFSNLALTMVFNTYDTNHSGRISKAEYMAAVRKHPEWKTAAAEWKAMDPTGRGYITLPDYLKDQTAVNQMKKEFRKLDKSGKGFITMSDLPAVAN